MLAASVLAVSSMFHAGGALPIEPVQPTPAPIVRSMPQPQPLRSPQPRPVTSFNPTAIPENRRREMMGDFALNLRIDNGNIIVHIEHDEGRSWIDAKWPYSGALMKYVLEGAERYGYAPVDEADLPPEPLDDNTVRFYLEYVGR